MKTVKTVPVAMDAMLKDKLDEYNFRNRGNPVEKINFSEVSREALKVALKNKGVEV